MHDQFVLFLPGFMCDHRLFTPQVEALSAAGCTCLHADQRFGNSMQHIAEHILRTSPERFAAIGLSMGGLVSLELYRLAPERLTHLALINTTARADTAHDARQAQLKQVANGRLDLVLREDLKPHYLHPDNNTPERLALLSDMGLSLGHDVFRSQTSALSTRQSYLDMLPNIACPTLALTGDADTVCPIDRHAQIAALVPDCTLKILPDCGHLSTIEQPELVNEALLGLLKKPAARLP